MVPEDYIAKESSFIERIIGDLKLVVGDQAKLDQVYDELGEGLRRNLKLVKVGKKSMSQPWFWADLARLHESVHRAEAEWLKKGSGEQVNSRVRLFESQKLVCKGSLKGKEGLSRKWREAKSELNCPKTFWKPIRRLNVRNSKKNRNLLKVLDEDDRLRTGE